MESAISLSKRHTLFARAEQSDKDELLAPGTAQAGEAFRVRKFSLGYIRDLRTQGHFRLGLGVLGSVYSLPRELESQYGNSRSYMLFARVKIQ